MNQLNQSTPTTNNNQPVLSDVPKTTGLKESFKSIFKFMGSMLAITLSYPKYELNDAEANMLSEQADQVSIEFLPEVGSKWAKLSVFIISLFTIYGQKYMGYLMTRETKKTEDLKKSTDKPKQYNAEGIEIVMAK